MCGIFQQLYYRIEYEGNLVFYIANEFHLDKQYSAKTTLGNHVITIKMNGELTEEIKLNTFLVTFVAVEYYGDRLDIPGEYRKHFYISIEKCPMHFIA